MAEEGHVDEMLGDGIDNVNSTESIHNTITTANGDRPDTENAQIPIDVASSSTADQVTAESSRGATDNAAATVTPGVTFINTDPAGVIVDGGIRSEVTFTNCQFISRRPLELMNMRTGTSAPAFCVFRNCTLRDVHFQDCKFEGLNSFDNVTLVGMHYEGCRFRMNSLRDLEKQNESPVEERYTGKEQGDAPPYQEPEQEDGERDDESWKTMFFTQEELDADEAVWQKIEENKQFEAWREKTSHYDAPGPTNDDGDEAQANPAVSDKPAGLQAPGYLAYDRKMQSKWGSGSNDSGSMVCDEKPEPRQLRSSKRIAAQKNGKASSSDENQDPGQLMPTFDWNAYARPLPTIKLKLKKESKPEEAKDQQEDGEDWTWVDGDGNSSKCKGKATDAPSDAVVPKQRDTEEDDDEYDETGGGVPLP